MPIGINFHGNIYPMGKLIVDQGISELLVWILSHLPAIEVCKELVDRNYKFFYKTSAMHAIVLFRRKSRIHEKIKKDTYLAHWGTYNTKSVSQREFQDIIKRQ